MAVWSFGKLRGSERETVPPAVGDVSQVYPLRQFAFVVHDPAISVSRVHVPAFSPNDGMKQMDNSKKRKIIFNFIITV